MQDNQTFVLHKKKIPANNKDVEIQIIQSEALLEAGFVHGFSTRTGGVSPLPSEDLNLSFKNDKEAFVSENRNRLLKALTIENWTIATVHQTHSDRTAIIDSQKETSEQEADSLISDQKNLVIGVKTADCLPILIGDIKTKSFMAVHAGWRGTVKKICQKALSTFVNTKNGTPENCLAVLGPAACLQCYEVGDDVWEAFNQEFDYAKELFHLNEKTGKKHLSTQQANLKQLLDSGIKRENIHVSSFCTIHDNDLFFSHRKEAKIAEEQKRSVGRMLSIIGRTS